MENDILVSGSGNDSLRGNGGSDLFVILTPAANPIIEDFSQTDKDVIDISHVLTGTSTALANYVQLRIQGPTDELAHCLHNGSGVTFTTVDEVTAVLEHT